MTQAALDEGRPVQEVLSEGLIAGMSVVGEDFKYNILYVPEVLIAARAMKAGMAVLKPLLAAKDSVVEPAGVLVMGTVRGDLHDIGKNLVCMMAEGAGFEVHDIGVDQSIEKFLAAYEQHKPDIIGMSALLTTTMTYMKTVIDGFKEKRPRPRQNGHRRRAHQPDVRGRNRRGRLRRGRLERGGFVFVFCRQGRGAQGQIQAATPSNDVKAERAASRGNAPGSECESEISSSLLAGHSVGDEGVGRFRRNQGQPARRASPSALTPRRRGRDSSRPTPTWRICAGATRRSVPAPPHEVAEAVKRELEAKFLVIGKSWKCTAARFMDSQMPHTGKSSCPNQFARLN